MSLDSTKLKNLILAITSDYNNMPISTSEALDRFTDAYDLYALDAVDGTGDGPLSVNKAGFKSSLSFPLGTSPSAAANSLESAITAYWTGATFKPLTPPPGGSVKLSSSIIIPPVPNGSISPVFGDLSPSISADDKAQQVADAMHSITITGQGLIQYTLISGSPGPPIPFFIS